MTEGHPYSQKRGRRSDNYGFDSKPEIVTINSGSRYPKTVIRFDRERIKLHPTQKPVSLFEYLIRTYTNEGDTVLDNAIGSGTTAIACINTGRRYLGFEKDTRYFQIAQDRIKAHTAQQTLTA
jgi:site-specific DNA-methyltransferase (adenine-specific)